MEKETKIDEARQGEVMAIDSQVGRTKSVFLESYGCAMNFSDSEIVASILADNGYKSTTDYSTADLVLVNTCSIRDNAEQRVRKRLETFNKVKRSRPGMLIGILGCMAERLKTKWLEDEKQVDIVVGPDSYRELPELIREAEAGSKGVNVLLSREETYADVSPVRLNSNGVTAFISIMRGCDNMCSFCVVPFTRGRERSRDADSIVHEARYLFEQGYREVTLLGQNVDSYRWNLNKSDEPKDSSKESVNFAQLLEMVALVDPLLRVRFSTSHPKDMTDEVLHTMAKYDNICKHVHLPVQSGNSEILKKMNRGYTREWYFDRINAVKRILPGCSLSTDIIAGFCGETESQHQETVSLMKEVGFSFAYMYTYSERPKTLAERKYQDDVPEGVKMKRLQEIVAMQREESAVINRSMVGTVSEVLVEGFSKRSNEHLSGRNTQNIVVVFPKKSFKKGDVVRVKISDCTSGTLIGEPIEV